MAAVAVEKSQDMQHNPIPALAEIEKRFQAIQRRAFEIFDGQRCADGHALENWLKAERETLGWSAGELSEDDGGYHLDLALPGFTANEVEVSATPAGLIVHAKSKKESKFQGRRVLWSEFGADEVYRRVDLPQAINIDKTAASLDHGRLHIEAAKAAPEKHGIQALAA
ncbi:MAG TPA: Hsp20/alpha crystallin family protein [Terriglobales bacterium]|nr:Hsp20/alpha crystallin family protein [Terriglobales bacterium]